MIGRCFPVSSGNGLRKSIVGAVGWWLVHARNPVRRWSVLGSVRYGARRKSESRRNHRQQQIKEHRFIEVYTRGTRRYIAERADEQGCKFAYVSVWDHAFFCGGECRVEYLKKLLTRRRSALPEETWTNEHFQYL